MSRITHGNLTGRAAVTQRADLTDEILRGDQKQALLRLHQQEEVLCEKCIAIEGNRAFWAWYVPNFGKVSERIELIQKHYEQVRDIRVAEDAARFIALWGPKLTRLLRRVALFGILCEENPEQFANPIEFGSKEWFESIPEIPY